jgi:hypothetical protein
MNGSRLELSQESEKKIAQQLRDRDAHPMLDQIGQLQNEIGQNLQVDMQRTKTFFGMVIDGLQYLAMQAEGDDFDDKGNVNQNVEQAKAILAHFFRTMDRAEASLEQRTQPKPKKILLPLNSNPKNE